MLAPAAGGPALPSPAQRPIHRHRAGVTIPHMCLAGTTAEGNGWDGRKRASERALAQYTHAQPKAAGQEGERGDRGWAGRLGRGWASGQGRAQRGCGELPWRRAGALRLRLASGTSARGNLIRLHSAGGHGAARAVFMGRMQNAAHRLGNADRHREGASERAHWGFLALSRVSPLRARKVGVRVGVSPAARRPQ